MSRYDGLIIPRSYSEYINKTDAATLLQALQQSGVMDAAPTAGSNHPVKSSGVNAALNSGVTLNQLINALPQGMDAAADQDLLISQYAGGVQNAYYRRTVKNVMRATNKNDGIALGDIFIEYIDIEKTNITISTDGSIYSITLNDVYTFKHSFTNPPIVIVNTQAPSDYVYSAPIGLVVTKTKIHTLKVIRPATASGNYIRVRGIAIGQ